MDVISSWFSQQQDTPHGQPAARRNAQYRKLLTKCGVRSGLDKGFRSIHHRACSGTSGQLATSTNGRDEGRGGGKGLVDLRSVGIGRHVFLEVGLVFAMDAMKGCDEGRDRGH